MAPSQKGLLCAITLLAQSRVCLITFSGSNFSGLFLFSDMQVEYTVFTMVAKAFVSVSYSSVYVYTSELYPTEVRNIGAGTALMCANISGMIAPYVGGPLVSGAILAHPATPSYKHLYLPRY